MLVLTFSISLCILVLAIISSIPSAQAFHLDGNVMYDLEYQGADFAAEAASWGSNMNLVTSGLKTMQCGSNTVLGGYNILAGSSGNYGSWYKTYSNLPSHNTIYFKMKVYLVDFWGYWASDCVHIDLDGDDVSPWPINQGWLSYSSAYQWGSTSYKDLDPMIVYFTVPHSSSSLTLTVAGQFEKDSSLQSFAIRDVTMTFVTEATVPSKSYCAVSGGWPLPGDVCDCGSGTTMSPANTGICTGCDSSCLTCNGAGNTKCTSCSAGKYLVNGACSSCHSSCLTCNGALSNYCTSCSSSFYLSNGYCNSCHSSCLTCYGAGTRTACTSCQSPLVLVSGTCCDPSCATCTGTTSSNCASCATGRYLSSGSCSSCDSSCLACSGAGRTACTSCQSPLLLIGSTCCHASCATCSGTSSTSCTSCAVGKYLSNGQCLACDSSCLTCPGPGRTACASCQSPLVLISGTCCDPSCATCTGTSSTNCASCASGKYLSSGSCNNCDSSCLTCSAGGRTACTSCQSPLVLISGSCCDPSCATCSGTTSSNCASCGTGKYLLNGQCLACDSSCSTCNGAGRTACTSCLSPLILVSGTCCDASCTTCMGTSSTNCASCAAGKYLTNSNSCSSCDSSCLTCSSGGPTGCTTCPSNKYLSATSCYDSCESPLVKSSSGGIDYCDTPCAGQYAYLEGGCGLCSSPRKKVQKNGFGVCGTPCSDYSTYYYWNGSCLSMCPLPLYQKTDPTGSKFCNNPCGATSSDFLFYNQSCLGTCPSPLSEIQDPGVQYCLSPCDSGSFLYENKTCINNCQSPFLKRLEPFAEYCDRPCDPGFFWFRNASCLASCPAPYVQILWSGILECLPPCSDSEFFYEFEKKCYPKCESPFSMKTFDVIKICYNEIPISYSETLNIQDAAKGMESQGSMASGGMKAAGAMNSGSPSSALLAGLSSMLQYIRYMKINYPPKVQMLFVVSAGSPISLGFDFNIPESIAKKLDDNRLPEVFEKYDINSNFVNNLWDFLMTLLIILVVIGMLSVLAFVAPKEKYPRISLILSKISGAIRWNVPIMMVCSSCGDIFFYASLQIQSSHLNSFAAIICVVVSVLMMIVVCVILMIGFKILRNFKEQSENPNWAEKWKGYEILYEEYEENSIWSLSYMILFLMRGIIFNLTLANLFNFPLIQCIIINVSNIMMFSYLLYLRPLKNFLNLVQLFVNEGLVNIIGVSIIILAIMDKAGISGKSTRASVGDAIYFVIKIFNTFGLAFMGLGLLIFLMLLYKTWRRLKAQKINSPVKIFKAMILGEVVKESVPNPFETNGVFKRAKIRKPPRREHSIQTTQANEVIYIEETEMSRVQMFTDVTINDGLSNGDFTPQRNPVLQYQDDVSDLQITELEIQPSYKLTRGEFGAKEESFRMHSIETEADKSIEIMRNRPRNPKRKILENRSELLEPVAGIKDSEMIEKVMEVETGKTEIEGAETVEDPQKKVRGPEATQVRKKKEVLKETGVSDIQVAEVQNKKKSGGFIQDWGKFKGRMKSRRTSNMGVDHQEQAMETIEAMEAIEERGEIRKNPQETAKNSSVKFIQGWGRFKGRMKARELSDLNLNQEETVEKIKDIEIMEITENIQEKKKANVKGRIARRQPKNLSAPQVEKSEIMKTSNEEVIEKRSEIGDCFIQDWGNLKSRIKSKELRNVHHLKGKKLQVMKTNNKEEALETGANE